jgi:hypothetical protein
MSTRPSPELAAPLLTCRQFYGKARLIAWKNIDRRVDWETLHHNYYDGLT